MSEVATATVEVDGFAFLHAPETRAWLEATGTLDDWAAFAASWDGMPHDTYMADGGRYRRRRHAAFAAGANGIVRKPHQAHFQTTDYNPLNGGVARWFEPMPEAVGTGATMQAILAATHDRFGRLRPGTAWDVEIHQFRIEARPGEAGRPTPEGLHRDGVDYVLVLLVARRNIASGTTTIHDLGRAELGSFTLTEPLDAALVDDRRVFHGVTAVQPIVADEAAFRDVLVVTYRARA